jgi:peptidoglycan hydrolase-like protein with peptidoglycan-binding domain
MNRQGSVLFEAPLAHETPVNLTKEPFAVGPGSSVPFAVPPPIGSYWPIQGISKAGRHVSYSYKASDGSIKGIDGLMFMANRRGKRDNVKGVPRWHVGVDLLAKRGSVVVACEKGTIVGFHPFTKAKSGKQQTYALLIEHSTAVVNYGEVVPLDRNIWRKDTTVQAGQPIGFVGNTDMLHFETYIKGTKHSYQWWKDEAQPPQQLLNPTKYLLFLQEFGLSQQGPVPPSVPPGPQPAPSPQRPLLRRGSRGPAVQDLQARLNQWMTRQRQITVRLLKVDGIFGSLTQGAVCAFQRWAGLKVDGVVGPPMWGRLLRMNPGPRQQPGSQPSPSTTPTLLNRVSQPFGTTLYVDIRLGQEAPATPMTGIFIPDRYRLQQRVDLIVYLHGYKSNNPDWSIDRYWQDPRWPLREKLNESGKNVILVAPTVGPRAEADRLTTGNGFDRYLDMVMASLSTEGPYKGRTATVGNIIIAGHSGAGFYMKKLIGSNQQYVALIREGWGFDCMYNTGDAIAWSNWVQQNPTNTKFYNYYIKNSPYKKNTIKESQDLEKIAIIKKLPIITTPLDTNRVPHDWVPITFWKKRIQNAPFLLNR